MVLGISRWVAGNGMGFSKSEAGRHFESSSVGLAAAAHEVCVVSVLWSIRVGVDKY